MPRSQAVPERQSTITGESGNQDRAGAGAWSRGAPGTRPPVTFAGVHPEDVETFVERSTPPDPDCLERWKQLEREGWDVTALVDDQATTMVGLGCRYLSATREMAV